MVKIPSLFFVAKKELMSPTALFISVFLGLLYFIFSAFLLNYHLVISTITSSFVLSEKVFVLWLLIVGIFSALPFFDIVIFILNSLLVGLNLFLIGKTLYMIEKQGKVYMSVGGATLFSLVTTGCTSCGLTLLSVVGLSGALTLLPFHGKEVQILSLLLLFFSIWYMIKKLRDSLYCKRK